MYGKIYHFLRYCSSIIILFKTKLQSILSYDSFNVFLERTFYYDNNYIESLVRDYCNYNYVHIMLKLFCIKLTIRDPVTPLKIWNKGSSQDGKHWCLLKVLRPRNTHTKYEQCTFIHVETEESSQTDVQTHKQTNE